MMTQIRCITMNVCMECSNNQDKSAKYITQLLARLKVDIVFMQETNGYTLPNLAERANMQILNVTPTEYTCVMINPEKLAIIDKYHVRNLQNNKSVYVGAVHLDDIPSIPHHMHNIIYRSSITLPLTYSMDQILELSASRRLPRLRKEVAKSRLDEQVIIAGDFNEPSHLDLKTITPPCSKYMEAKGFLDTYKHIHPHTSQHTWPNKHYYTDEPKQRVDYIYTRNITIVKSQISGDVLSDHKLVISDILI